MKTQPKQKEGHGYCLKCDLETQPTMKCKCAFGKDFIEEKVNKLAHKALSKDVGQMRDGTAWVVNSYFIEDVRQALQDTYNKAIEDAKGAVPERPISCLDYAGSCGYGHDKCREQTLTNLNNLIK